ncbi:CRISPR-associated helicase Cas3' [Desulfobacter sp.]|uniref:CRISPR-associated helicase Cas3' n=1 Tax=Desulfobacter sp. TaxID=2294 RepID=UPI00257F7EDF|nr:CRISPR-associated helicase Cas3' [Desulfobacter sp.]
MKTEIKYYAHSLQEKPKQEWQLLANHLTNVADMAGCFSDSFRAKKWGYCAGLLHDAGKATSAFQRRLEGSPERVDHSTFGAIRAKEIGGNLGLLLSYAIAGHHGGIPDGGEQETQLHFRLKHNKSPEAERLDVLKPCLDGKLDFPFKISRENGGFSLSFFTRMIFSCLVDADFLDTEKFCASEIFRERVGFPKKKNLLELQQDMKAYMEKILAEAQPTYVNGLRKTILKQCEDKALFPPQFFSLTVPTGGGKTLSSMNFALDHATEHGMNRIIYAIPFTSIIEQNAEIFQNIFGQDSVLEHHCNYKESEDPEDSPYNRRRGLATENWDNPIIVTTNVQFFESLFSNKSSRCRKLHSIARSVIVLDEAQAVPTDYLEPCLAALRELVDHYGCTIVLCTATQPAFDDTSSLRAALPKLTEIIDDPDQIFSKLKRTEVSFIGEKTDEEVAELINYQGQALCIAATKAQARTIFNLVNNDAAGVFHLSTNMYPLHRKQILAKIKERLKENKKCIVVSTSLVEAGVDLDFPVVFRAIAGLDSIAQAAGRCNREGKMEGFGQVFVFEPEKKPRMPWLNRCISKTAETMRSIPDCDPIGIMAMRRYFELLYDIEDLDKKQIVRLLNPKILDKNLLFPFKEVAQAFKFIEEDTVGVVIPRESEAQKLIEQLRHTEFPGALLRNIQPYLVAVRAREYVQLYTGGAIELLHDQIPVLQNGAAYSDDVGLVVEKGETWNADDLII